MAKLPVGIQVYGLRDLLEKSPENFKPVMEKVKALGYDGVELAGLYGLAPEKIREILEEVGLVPISAHVPFQDMMGDLDRVIADYSRIGVRYLVMPYMAPEYRPEHPEGFRRFLPMLEEVGRKVHEAGMTFLYHNHDFEFVKLPDGGYGYDALFAALPREVLQCELDTCWCSVATGRPTAFIEKYAQRLPVVHLKDYIKRGQPKGMYQLIGVAGEEETAPEDSYFGFRPVGFGQMLWEPILEAVERSDAKWVIVEQDMHYELDPLECARRSREYLKILGW